jgi:hypothetical protein
MLLIGLMAISSISGSFTVICHAADGHITMEPVFHNDCGCPETEAEANPVSMGSYCLDEHGQCQDYLASSNLVVPSNNTVRQAIQYLFTACLVQHVDFLIHISHLSNIHSLGDQLPAFHAPLRTVILLA